MGGRARLGGEGPEKKRRFSREQWSAKAHMQSNRNPVVVTAKELKDQAAMDSL